MSKIGLGWKVCDRVTGLTGIVMHTIEYAYQGEMVGVAKQELDKDGRVSEQEMFDVAQVEVIDNKPLFDAPAPEPFKFKMGDKVRDTITGYEGSVAGLATYVNGCNRILVRPSYKKDKDDNYLRKGEFIGEGALELIENTKKEIKSEKRGGPADFNSARRG